MVDVGALSESDWDWLHGVLGDERVGDSERPDRLGAALVLRGEGMDDERIRGWVDAVDAASEQPTLFDRALVDRVLDFDRRCIAPAFGGPWLLEEAPARFVPQLIAAGRTVEEFHQFTEAAWSDDLRWPPEGEGESLEGLFLIRWLLCSNFPLDEALAYVLAGVGAEEALEAWEPLRRSHPERWASALQFLAAMVADPDAGPDA